jgi:hypothetical protein
MDRGGAQEQKAEEQKEQQEKAQEQKAEQQKAQEQKAEEQKAEQQKEQQVKEQQTKGNQVSDGSANGARSSGSAGSGAQGSGTAGAAPSTPVPPSDPALINPADPSTIGQQITQLASTDGTDNNAAEGGASPLDMVPEGASLRVLTPDPRGGAQEGVEFKWINEEGQTVRLRIHGPDGTAPPGSNAAEGSIYRIQVGGRYMDAEGNLYPRGVYNLNSPYYDPEAANATHIPWPPDVPLPW